MKQIYITAILLTVFCSNILGQYKYIIETTTLLEQVLLDSIAQNKFNFRANVLYDPPYTSSDDYLIDLKRKSYNSIADIDSILGIRNPFNKKGIKKNKKQYYAAIENYSYNNSLNQVIKYSATDSERIFEMKYWKPHVDSTGHAIKHLTKNEKDSLFNKEMDKNWNIFHSEFGDCFVSYEVPIFNDDFSYCFLEWAFACRQGNGKGFRGLFRKENGKWEQITFREVWSNE